MSVQRSPPASSTLQIPSKSTGDHYNSDSALNAPKSSNVEDLYFNITKRHKRNFDAFTDDKAATSTEIREMFDTKFEVLNNALISIINQNQEIQKTIAVMSQNQDKLLSKITVLEQENTIFKNKITSLENKIESLERHKLTTSMEIRNVPKSGDENKETLIKLVKNISNSVNMERPIEESDINNIYRNKSETVVVSFTSGLQKESLIACCKKYNKSKRLLKEPSLNTEVLKLPGPSRPIYISESLTSFTSHLFFQTREAVKSKKLVAAWTSHGTVYVKKEDTSRPTPIKHETDLQSLL